ncbi:MAG TPA: ATP-binding protein [Solirubrobacterales bacterium]|nr:ATP-binding protein [Solirubrobacterales bacterium]
MRQAVEGGSADAGGFELTMPAEPASVPALRRRASQFAAAEGAGRLVVEDIALAVSEAVTNAVKYAGADEGGVVELLGSRRGDSLEVIVRDRGEAFGKGSPDGLGLGLAIIARLCSDLKIVQEGDGTEVRMRFPLAA